MNPGGAAVEAAAALAARELAWSPSRTAEEITAVRAFFAEHRAAAPASRGSRSAALP